MTKRGLFIVFEGIDSSGKTTQMGAAADVLYRHDNKTNVLMTREPTALLRTLFEQTELTLEQLPELFVKDRREHISSLVEPLLAQGVHVLCDRYIMSTFAYQQTTKMSWGDIERLHQEHNVTLTPDLVFFLDVNPDQIRDRRGHEDMTDQTLWRVYRNYLSSLHMFGGRVVSIAAHRDKRVVAAQIREILEALLQTYDSNDI